MSDQSPTPATETPATTSGDQARPIWFLLPLGLVLAGLALSWFLGRSPTREGRIVGKTMPALTVEFVQGAALFGLQGGEKVTLDDTRGKILILNFWASWCESCRDEVPELESFWKAHKAEGVAVFGVAFHDEISAVRTAIGETGKTYPVALDLNDRGAAAYGITGVPETFFIKRDGTVFHHETGPLDREFLESVYARMMASP